MRTLLVVDDIYLCMVDFESVKTVEFPQIPKSVRTNDEARQAIVKASAYVTFSLEEGGVEHERDLSAAMVTDATHSLKEDQTPAEYLELAMQELAFAEGVVDDERVQNGLASVRETIQHATS